MIFIRRIFAIALCFCCIIPLVSQAQKCVVVAKHVQQRTFYFRSVNGAIETGIFPSYWILTLRPENSDYLFDCRVLPQQYHSYSIGELVNYDLLNHHLVFLEESHKTSD